MVAMEGTHNCRETVEPTTSDRGNHFSVGIVISKEQLSFSSSSTLTSPPISIDNGDDDNSKCTSSSISDHRDAKNDDKEASTKSTSELRSDTEPEPAPAPAPPPNDKEKNEDNNLVEVSNRPLWRLRNIIFKPDSRFIRRWDGLTTILVVVLAFIVPWQAAFGLHVTGLWVIGYSIDLLLIINVLIKFRQSFSEKGNLITDRRRIMIKYLKGNFAWDFMGSLPLDLVCLGWTGDDRLKILAYVRLNRLLHFERVLVYFQSHENNLSQLTNIMRSLKFALLVAFVTQFAACIWHIIAIHAACPDNWLCTLTSDNQDTFFVYIQALYWTAYTLTTTGYGELKLYSIGEQIYAEFLMVFGKLFFGYILGVLASSIANADAQGVRYREKLHAMNTYLADKKLPDNITERVFDYYEYIWECNKGVNGRDMVRDLPLTLQTEVSMEMSHGVMDRVPLFQNADSGFLRMMSLIIKPVLFLPNEFIVRIGDVSQEMHIIQRGTIAVLDENGNTISILEKGHFFGEVGLFYDMPRTASMQAISHCDLLVLTKTDFVIMLEHYPHLAEQITLVAKERFRKARCIVGGGSNDIVNFSKSDGGIKDMQRASLVLDTGIDLKFESDIEEECSYQSPNNRESVFVKNADVLDIQQVNKSDSNSIVNTSKNKVLCFLTLHPRLPALKVWDEIMVWVSFIICIIAPFQAAFDNASIHLWIITYFLDAVFIGDMAMRFCVGYRNGNDAVLSAALIRRRYLRTPGLFLIDFLSVLPTDLLALIHFDEETLQVLAYARFNRVLRAWRILRHFNDMENNLFTNTSKSRAYKFFLYISLTVHWLSCIWYIVGCRGSCLDVAWKSSLPGGIDTEATSIVSAYILSMYWTVASVTSTGFGDITAVSSASRIFAIIVMFGGLGLFGYVLGSIASALANAETQITLYKEKLDVIRRYMADQNIPKDMADRVYSYYEYMWFRNRGVDGMTLLEDMPMSLRGDVALHVNQHVIEKVPLFTGTEGAFIRMLSLVMKPILFLPREFVIKKGDIGRAMFFIYRGSVDVVAEDDVTVYATLKSGDFFGEVALLFRCPRTASIRTRSHCDLFMLEKNDLDNILSKFPNVMEQVNEIARSRLEFIKQKVKEEMEALGVFINDDDDFELEGNENTNDDMTRGNREIEQLAVTEGNPRFGRRRQSVQMRMDAVLAENDLPKQSSLANIKTESNSDTISGSGLLRSASKELTSEEENRELSFSIQALEKKLKISMANLHTASADDDKHCLEHENSRDIIDQAIPSSISKIGASTPTDDDDKKRASRMSTAQTTSELDNLDIWAHSAMSFLFTGILDPVWPFLHRVRSVMVTSCIIICSLVPFQAVFDHVTPGLWVVSYLLDAIMLYYISVQFRVSFQVRDEMVTSRRAITLKYITSTWGIFDILSILPLDFLSLVWMDTEYLALMRLNRMLRVFRIGHYFSEIEGKLDTNAIQARVMKFLIYIAMTLHIFACIWFAIACAPNCRAGTWASVDGFALDNGTSISTDIVRDYVASVYWTSAALTSTGYGDIHANKNDGERVYSIIVMLVGVLLFSFVLGGIVSTLANAEAQRVRYEQKLHAVKVFMNEQNLTTDLKGRVIDYYEYLWTRNRGIDGKSLFGDLPLTLQTEVSLVTNQELIEKVPLFQDTDVGFVRMLSLELRPLLFLPGHYVVRKGDIGREMFFIYSGTVDVVADDGSTVFASMHAGSFFGEISVIFDTPRTASIRVRTHCDCFVLTKQSLDSVLEEFPIVATQIMTVAARRREVAAARAEKKDSTDKSDNKEKTETDDSTKVKTDDADKPPTDADEMPASQSQVAAVQAAVSALAKSKLPNNTPSSLKALERKASMAQKKSIEHEAPVIVQPPQGKNSRFHLKYLKKRIQEFFRDETVEMNPADPKAVDWEKEKSPPGYMGCLRHPFAILDPRGLVSVTWERWVVFWTSVMAFIIPYQVVFDNQSLFFWIVGYFADAIFLLDIWVNLKRGYYSGHIVVYEPSRTRRHYLRGWFLWDIFTSLPTDFIAIPFSLETLAYLRLNRMGKFFRVPIFYNYLEEKLDSNTGLVRVMKFFTYVVLAPHWLTCLWFSLVPESPFEVALRIGVMDAINNANTWLTTGQSFETPFELFFSTGAEKYITSFYWTTATLTSTGYGDIVASGTNEEERIYAVFVMVTGVLFYGYIISTIASTLANLDSQRVQYLDKMRGIQAWMSDQHFNTNLEARVTQYYRYYWKRNRGIDGKSLFYDLPVTFQAEVSLTINHEVMKRVPLFQNTDIGFMRMLSLVIKPVLFLDKEYIVCKGDIGGEMFFIQTGIVEVVSEDGSMVFASMKDGDFFGEISLIFSVPRTASIRAKTYCDLFVLSKADLDTVLEHYSHITEQINKVAEERFSAAATRNKAKEVQETTTTQDTSTENIKAPPRKDPVSIAEKLEATVNAGLERARSNAMLGLGNVSGKRTTSSRSLTGTVNDKTSSSLLLPDGSANISSRIAADDENSVESSNIPVSLVISTPQIHANALAPITKASN